MRERVALLRMHRAVALDGRRRVGRLCPGRCVRCDFSLLFWRERHDTARWRCRLPHLPPCSSAVVDEMSVFEKTSLCAKRKSCEPAGL